MKKVLSLSVLGAAAAVFCLAMNVGLAQDSVVVSDPMVAPSEVMPACAATADPSCAAADATCDPCADACGECYNGCGYGYGCGYGVGYGCGAGLLSVVHGAAEIALTPVHWVAGLLSCGTYGDCGCAPLPCRTYRDPCDQCGNWVGGAGCSSCGTDMIESAAPIDQGVSMQTNPEQSDYINFSKVETIGQKKMRQMKAPAEQIEEIPQSYIYSEEVVNGAPKQVSNGKYPASRQGARVSQRVATRPTPARSVRTNNVKSQTNNTNR